MDFRHWWAARRLMVSLSPISMPGLWTGGTIRRPTRDYVELRYCEVGIMAGHRRALLCGRPLYRADFSLIHMYSRVVVWAGVWWAISTMIENRWLRYSLLRSYVAVVREFELSPCCKDTRYRVV